MDALGYIQTFSLPSKIAISLAGFILMLIIAEWALYDHSSSLRIFSALYGTRDHRINVAPYLRSKVKANSLNVFVGNQMGGDPTPNVRKDLRLEYEYCGSAKYAVLAEGDTLKIP